MVKRYRDILSTIRNSTAMNHLWNVYKKNYDYAAEVEFEDICDAVVSIINRIHADS